MAKHKPLRKNDDLPIFAASDGWIRINAIGSFSDVDPGNKNNLV